MENERRYLPMEKYFTQGFKDVNDFSKEIKEVK